MNNPLKRLAGESAIYGLSTIIARIVNFFFVPLYTRMLSPADYGMATMFLAYIAILQVALTLGLETGCFRFAGKHEQAGKVFSNALATMAIVCSLFFISTALFSNQLASFAGREGFGIAIIYFGAIVAIDCFTAILFARLRYEHKAMKFAVFKTIKIVVELSANLLLFFVMPAYFAKHTHSVLLHLISATPDFTYMLCAIFLSCLIAFLLLIPDILRTRFSFNAALWKQMMLYSLPLMIAGIPGVANDFIDRVLFPYCIPKELLWEEQLGIYQAGAKLAVLMILFVQLFRYAAEPFFFGEEKNKNAPKLYAEVMNHFTAFCMCIFLFVMFYIDGIGLFLGKDFRTGLNIVPVMLGANVLLGLTFNLSMWYKLSGKTQFALYITSAGLLVTVLVNVLFMPRYGYHAAAWGHFFSYLLMAVLSARMGAKHYPIPYNWTRVIAYIFVGAALYFTSIIVPFPNVWIKWTVCTILLVAYAAFWLRLEKLNLLNIIRPLIKNKQSNT